MYLVQSAVEVCTDWRENSSPGEEDPAAIRSKHLVACILLIASVTVQVADWTRSVGKFASACLNPMNHQLWSLHKSHPATTESSNLCFNLLKG
jgi:hypothetical protein